MKGGAGWSIVLLPLLAAGCFGPWKPIDDSSWSPPWRRPVASPGTYRAIALHASGTDRGDAASLVGSTPSGLPFHFVIGNGTVSGNGQIEIGPRWSGQAPSLLDGKTSAGPETIDICLIGTFATEPPFGQTTSALALIIHLTEQYRIPDEAIVFGPALVQGSIDPEEFLGLVAGTRLEGPPPQETPSVDPEPFGLP